MNLSSRQKITYLGLIVLGFSINTIGAQLFTAEDTARYVLMISGALLTMAGAILILRAVFRGMK